IFQNLTNIEAVSDVVGLLAPLSVTMIKIIKLHTSQKRIHELIESIHKPIELLKYSSELEILTTIRTAVFYQNFELALFASVLSVVFSLVFFKSLKASDGLAFFIQFWAILIGCIWFALFDLLVLGSIRWINVQIEILQSNYRNCEPATAERDNFFVTEDTYLQIENYEYFKVTEGQYKIKVFAPFESEEMNVIEDSFILRLKTCLKHHQGIINCIDKFNDTFSLTLPFQMLTSNAVMCFYLYQASWAIKHNKSIIKCVILFFSVITELFYYCISGTLLTLQGEALRDSQYNVPWHNYLNREVGDLLIIALIQSVKPLEIKAGYFSVFSVKTFLSVIFVLQKASSFYAILNTVMD
ncbi:GSCOCT00002620001.3-RA-CDS, partial [Cotesia congregata]